MISVPRGPTLISLGAFKWFGLRGPEISRGAHVILNSIDFRGAHVFLGAHVFPWGPRGLLGAHVISPGVVPMGP